MQLRCARHGRWDVLNGCRNDLIRSANTDLSDHVDIADADGGDDGALDRSRDH